MLNRNKKQYYEVDENNLEENKLMQDFDACSLYPSAMKRIGEIGGYLMDQAIPFNNNEKVEIPRNRSKKEIIKSMTFLEFTQKYKVNMNQKNPIQNNLLYGFLERKDNHDHYLIPNGNFCPERHERITPEVKKDLELVIDEKNNIKYN